MKAILVSLIIALLLIGCGANAEPSQAETTQTMPEGHPSTDASMTAQQGAETITGKVAETMNGGGYTYMKLTGESGETWVAVPMTEVEAGQDVTVSVQMTMTDFTSTALNRTFDSLVFATMGGMPASPHGQGGMGMEMGMGSKPPVDLGDINVEKASGANAKTVEELWAQRTDLADSSVVVRGKVVKFLPSIMGRNWVHLRDGSGTEEAATNDITVTTDATVAVGDVVVATGVVRVDKDLGAGYKYPVILEDGTFAK